MRDKIVICCFGFFVFWSISSCAFGESSASYIYLDLGVGNVVYKEDVEKLEGLDNVVVSPYKAASYLEIGGYWPLGGRRSTTLLGFRVGSGASQTVEYNGDDYTFSNSFANFSIIHYLGHELGDDFFFRGDVGLGMLGLSEEDGKEALRSVGVNYLLGVGYSFMEFHSFRLVFGLNFSECRARLDDSDIGRTITSFSIGVLSNFQ